MKRFIFAAAVIVAMVFVGRANAGGCGVAVQSFGFAAPVVVSSPFVVQGHALVHPQVFVHPHVAVIQQRAFVASPVIVQRGIRVRSSQGGFFGFGFIGPNRARAVSVR